MAKEAERAEKRKADEAIHQVQRETREKERLQQQYARQHERIVQTSLRWEQTARERADRETERSMRSAMQRRERMIRSVGGVVGGGVSAGIGMAGRLAGVAAGVMGGFSVAGAMQAGMREESMAGELIRGSVNSSGVNRADVVSAAKAQTIRVGGTTEDKLAGLGTFVRKTGDMKAAMDMLQEMSDLSAATGTHFEDMGSTAAEVFSQLKEVGQQNQTMGVMRSLAGMGRAGAVDIKDLGQYGGRLAASAAMFQGDISGNIGQLGAVAQLAKRLGGATDAAEATMAVQHLGADVARQRAQEHLAKYGINVWANKEKTMLRGPEDIITESVAKTGGNLQALQEIFGERSIRAVRGAQVAYRRAGGGSAGEAAIRAQFQELRTTALSKEDVSRDVAMAKEETERKLQIATEEYHKVLQDKLLPLLPQLVNHLTALVPALSRFLGFLAENPFKGIGLILTAAITGEIAKAGLGLAVKSAIEAALRGLLPPAASGAAGAAPAAAGLLGKAAAATGASSGLGLLAGAALPVAAGVAAGAGAAAYFQTTSDKTRAGVAELIAQAQTPADAGAAKGNVARLQEMVEKAKASKKFEQMVATSPVPLPLASSKTAETHVLAESLPKLTQALEEATRKLNEFGGAAGEAKDQLGTGDGRASQTDPSRGPIQIGH
ncbi:MAG: hypothetical protein WC551_07670 [Patescibacteria group bacterium]